jgi:hypothetical protein
MIRGREQHEIKAFSFIQYPSRQNDAASNGVREIIRELKRGRLQIIQGQLADNVSKTGFIGDALLIPIPRSAPLVSDSAVWPSLEICNFIEKCTGSSVLILLKRETPVNKAGLQGSASYRPSVLDHCQSIVCETDNGVLTGREKIILVDDIITQGRTATACYLKLRDRFKTADISAFAPIRTVSFDKTITETYKPSISTIVYHEKTGKSFVNHG